MAPTYGRLIEAETGRVTVSRLEIADTIWKRALGLLGRDELAAGSGLCLQPCNGIHTLGMRFSLDLLILDRDGKAIRLVSSLRPWRFCGPIRGARTVLELPVGALETHRIQIGRRYRIEHESSPF